MRRLSVITLFLAALAASLAAQQTSAPPPAAPSLRAQQGQAPPPAQTQPAGRGAQPSQPPASQTPPSGQRGAGRGSGTAPPEPTASARPGRSWEPATQNIRIEVAIADTADRSTRKVVSMLLADGGGGRIRSGNNQGVLNVDANASASSDSSRIQLQVTIEYSPDRSAATTTLNESVTLVLSPGKPTLVSQSADPGSERKVTVEVTATIVK